MVQRSPRASTRRIARRLRVPHTREWRTLHAEGMYPYQVKRVQHLGLGNFAERLEFCKWLNGSRQLHHYILFTDKAQFNRDCVNKTHNSHVWAGNFNYVLVSMYGLQFWMISWLVLSSWKVVLEERCTSDFCRRNCPEFWRMCLWITTAYVFPTWWSSSCLQLKLEIFWTIVSLDNGSDVAVPTIGQPGLQT